MATISLLFIGFLVSGLEAVTGTKRAQALYIVYIAYIMTVSICVCNSELLFALLFAYIVHITFFFLLFQFSRFSFCLCVGLFAYLVRLLRFCLLLGFFLFSRFGVLFGDTFFSP